MTFVERVMNLGAYLGIKLATKLVTGRAMNALKVKYNIKPERDYQEIVGDAEMVIITADFALEYPQPLLPGMKSFKRSTDWYLMQIRFVFLRKS